MGLSATWEDYIYIIALKPIEKIEVKPTLLSAPWVESLVIIAL